MTSYRKVLTVREAADRLQVSKSTVRRWADEDYLESFRLGTRYGLGDRRIFEDSIDKLMPPDLLEKTE